MITIARPGADEYAPVFAGYVARIAEDEDILAALASQLDEVLARLGCLPGARGHYRYAAGTWSIGEVLGHLSDTERVFAYRALRVGRGDSTPLPGFDDQSYVIEQRAAARPLADLLEEWAHVRRATIALLRNLPPSAWDRRGVAGDYAVSVRALAYVIAGHGRHHLETLGSRYGV